MRTDSRKTLAGDGVVVVKSTSISCKLLDGLFDSKYYEHESWFSVPNEEITVTKFGFPEIFFSPPA